jgi:hypothetical protein
MQPEQSAEVVGGEFTLEIGQMSSPGASQGALGGCAAMQRLADWLEKLGMPEALLDELHFLTPNFEAGSKLKAIAFPFTMGSTAAVLEGRMELT